MPYARGAELGKCADAAPISFRTSQRRRSSRRIFGCCRRNNSHVQRLGGSGDDRFVLAPNDSRNNWRDVRGYRWWSCSCSRRATIPTGYAAAVLLFLALDTASALVKEAGPLGSISPEAAFSLLAFYSVAGSSPQRQGNTRAVWQLVVRFSTSVWRLMAD